MLLTPVSTAIARLCSLDLTSTFGRTESLSPFTSVVILPILACSGVCLHVAVVTSLVCMCVSGGLAAVIYTDALQTIILVIGCFALTGIGQLSATFDQIIIIILSSDNSICVLRILH